MLRVFAISGALASCMVATEASASEDCFATIASPGEATRVVALSGFSVSGNGKAFVLPTNISDVAAIVCRRDSLFMSDQDYRVLTELHVAFGFGDGSRVVWLYVEDMRLLMHMDDGELSKAEQDQINAAIGRAQEIMLREGW